MSRILITGASGLVGTRLTQLLLERGHEVSHLGRGKKTGNIKSFVWDVNAGILSPEALQNVDCVIHLAGAGIADERWSKKRKQEIVESRTKSTALLVSKLNEGNNSVKTLVSASAIGYYGMTLRAEEFTEGSQPGAGFLADVVTAWEREADQVKNKRLVKIRIGVVLSKNDGALKEIAKPVRLGFGAPLGTGDQYVSWIHLDDLCSIFIKAVEDETLQGAYNATADTVTNRGLTKAIASTLHKLLWLPAVPGLALKLFLGEMADLVLFGSNVTSGKIRQAGFSFKYDTLEKALNNLLLH
jgi:uncharacterized protein (TIGR01777 family)